MFSIILGILAVLQLPPVVLYNLREGAAVNSITRAAFLFWTVAPQFLFMVVALVLVRLLMLTARYAPPGETPLLRLLPLMGNMVALPQIIIFIVLLQLFLDNAYDTGTIPVWIPAIVILAVGTIIIAVGFVRIIRRFRGRKVKTTRSDTDAG